MFWDQKKGVCPERTGYLDAFENKCKSMCPRKERFFSIPFWVVEDLIIYAKRGYSLFEQMFWSF